MISKTFKCTFLSDIVLNAYTATEGNQETLDYVPGSCFLGIAAKKYNSVSDAFRIFHSGEVSFGDAHIGMNGKRGLKQPAAWFYEKNDTNHSKIYLHHYLGGVIDSIKADFEGKQEGTQFQPKQIRSGYFIEDKRIDINTTFAIKSAYNFEERRSCDGQLYGYEALRCGTTWFFSIRASDEALLEEVKNLVVGEHNVGRSKTAQFGRVKIEPSSSCEWVKSLADLPENIIYFESNASFITQDGIATFKPTVEMLGFKGGQINWEKSQVLIKQFANWNNKRKSRDSDRQCILKGSVIVVDGGEFNKSVIENGVGIFRNEGFGRILYNPDFLIDDTGTACLKEPPIEICKPLSKLSAVKTTGKNDSYLIKWLINQTDNISARKTIIEYTNKFINSYGGRFKRISPSQWGSIRERATRQSSYTLMMNELFRPNRYRGEGMNRRIEELGGYLMHGKMEKQWKKLAPLLEREIKEVSKDLGESNARVFLINLCSEMAKHIATK